MEVIVEVTQTAPPELVTIYAVGPQGPPGSPGSPGSQGPPGPTIPPNQLPLATGPVNLAGNRLTGVGAPQIGSDAVNSTYLDTRFAVLIDELKPGPITQTKATVDANFALVSGFNGMSVGPVVIQDGKAVTIPANSTWVIF